MERIKNTGYARLTQALKASTRKTRQRDIRFMPILCHFDIAKTSRRGGDFLSTVREVRDMFEDLHWNRARMKELAGELEELRSRMYNPGTSDISAKPGRRFEPDGIGWVVSRIDSIELELERIKGRTDEHEVERLIRLVESSGELHAAEMGELLRLRFLHGMSTTAATEEVFGVDLKSTPKYGSYRKKAMRYIQRAFEINDRDDKRQSFVKRLRVADKHERRRA